MEKETVINALAALAQETRLDIFRYLVKLGPRGAPAGAIGERFSLPGATLSFHLKTLQQAGLLERNRQSRSLIYSANFTAMNELLAYLTENCCDGRPEDCLAPLCDPEKPSDSTSKTIPKPMRVQKR